MKTKIIVLGIILFTFAIFSAAPAVGRVSLQIQNATEKKAEEDRQQPAAEKVSETPEPKPQPTPETTAKRKLSFAYSGEITNYVVSDSHAFFGESSTPSLTPHLPLHRTLPSNHL